MKKVKRSLTSLQLRPQVKRMLSYFVSKTEMSQSDVINQALREFLMEKEFQALRSRGTKIARSKGIYTDEDVFRRLSD